MGTGAADSWYHEKESAWLYGEVAAVEPDPARRALFIKLQAAAEDQAACWLATRPELKPANFAPRFSARAMASSPMRRSSWVWPPRVPICIQYRLPAPLE